MRVDDIPVGDFADALDGGDGDDRRREGQNRRSILRLGVGLATFAGLSMLGIFKVARPALAGVAPYTEFVSKTNPYVGSACGSYDPPGLFAGNDCQDNMCVGTSYEYMDSAYCTTCAEESDSNWFQWHFNGKRGSFELRALPFPSCEPNPPYVADAWSWSTGDCGYCSPAVWRCHDGHKREAGGSWVFTICEGLLGCNGGPYGCP